MSCNYADGLSPYHDKGQLGLEEKFDSKSVVTAKVSLLAKWINNAKHVVIHTGAGISTAAGIPDFRGPKGVWTLQAKGEKPDTSKDFNEAFPTITHMAITKLVECGKVKYVVSQNIDGLHLRSNLPRKYLSELHGNMFTEQCGSCKRQFVRSSPVPTVGQKAINKGCPTTKSKGRPCRGRLHDTILDWEHNLPENDLGMADYHSCLADLSISLGTTMQIVPSGNLPLYTKRNGGKLVIINLQPTKHDKKADLLIHAYVDEVMVILMKQLGLRIPKYTVKQDPTRTLSSCPEKYIDWTISDHTLKKMKKIYEEKCGSKEARKRLEMIYDDIPASLGKGLKRKAKDEEDSDLEVLDVIVKPKKSRETSRRGRKNSSPVFNTTITIKKVTSPPKKVKYDGEKITIKKNVTPTKTKYEIVTKPKKVPKCEIVYSTDNDAFTDLDMVCESDDDEMTNNFTYNFKMYLQDDGKKDSKEEVTVDSMVEIKTELENNVKSEDQREEKNELVEDQKDLKENKTELIAKKEIVGVVEEDSENGEKKVESDLKISDVAGGNNSVQESEGVSLASETSNDVIKDSENDDLTKKESMETTESTNSREIEQMEIEEELQNEKVGEPESEIEKEENNKDENEAQEKIILTNTECQENSKMEIGVEKSPEEKTEAEKIAKEEAIKGSMNAMDGETTQVSQKEHIDKVSIEHSDFNSENLESEGSQISNSNLKNSLENSVDLAQSSELQNTVKASSQNEKSEIDFCNSERDTSNNSNNLDPDEKNYFST